MNNYTGETPKKVMQITIIFGISVHFYRNKQEPAGKPSLQACARNLFFQMILHTG